MTSPRSKAFSRPHPNPAPFRTTPLPAETLDRIDAQGRILVVADPDVALLEGEGVHRQLRTALGDDYPGYLKGMFDEGARLTQLVDDGEVRAVAVWRMFHTTYAGLRMEIDDLITAETARSKRYGATLLTFVEDKARALGCQVLTLNSGTQRIHAHRFYFRQRYAAVSFHFSKTL